jgi:hypothetical protein
MRNTFKFLANLVIIGFVLGRAYNEWQHRPQTFVARRKSRPRRVLPRPG